MQLLVKARTQKGAMPKNMDAAEGGIAERVPAALNKDIAGNQVSIGVVKIKRNNKSFQVPGRFIIRKNSALI